MIQFPQKFLWGAATSSYQVEGGNDNCDWWRWEKAAGKEQSGRACAHYELYASDFDLAQSLHHNAHRLSIEWSRVEPREGEFSAKEIQHYLDVILALKARGIEPVVTLHHFTNPLWMSDSGGWESGLSVVRFEKYCAAVVRALAAHVHYWITINEPTILISHAYLWGMWPPQAKSILRSKAVHNNLISAHIESYHTIHHIYEELNLPKPAVSISQHMQAIVPCQDNFRNRFAADLRDRWINFQILDKIMKNKAMDFIGLNYYSRQLVDVTSWWPGNILMETCKENHHPVKKNALGWDIYPEGLCQVLVKLKKYGLPVMVTENGVCTADDELRWEFVAEHLKSVHQAIAQGVDVSGYLYWSLLDNFEWHQGFGPRFGLIEVDYKTQQRIVRESARKFAEVCRTGKLE